VDEPTALEAETAARARADGLLSPGDRVLVAVSGGADSAATAALLCAAAAHGLPLRVVLGHVDHGWRGEAEAALDRREVERLAALLGVEARFAGPPLLVRRTEDDARRHRYGALARLAREAGAGKVATGHHARDQAETLLLRIARGSGPAGLAGIPASRPLDGDRLLVVRPVLGVDPARLRAYALARALPFRDDPTNAALDRDRSLVRARLAALGDRQAAVVRDLAETAARLRRRLERREAQVGARLAPGLLVHVEAEAVEADASVLGSFPAAWTSSALRVLGAPLAADRDGPWFTRRHADLVAAVARGAGTRVELPRGLVLERAGARVVLSRARPAPLAEAVLSGEGEARAGRFAVRREDVPAAGFSLAAWAGERRAGTGRPPWRAALDAEALGARLAFRGARAGDRFVPLGRAAPADVLAFLSRQGVPSALRRGVRVAVREDGVVAWVLGHRIDARFAVTPGTARVALLSAWTEAAASPLGSPVLGAPRAP
jgi:tRNA(Ile)-lysidine synthase